MISKRHGVAGGVDPLWVDGPLPFDLADHIDHIPAAGVLVEPLAAAVRGGDNPAVFFGLV